MASIYKEVRAALETQVSIISGIPPIAYDNFNYVPTTGVTYITTYFNPFYRRPAVMGINPKQLYRGSLNILVYAPYGEGAGPAEDVANLLLEGFEATTDLPLVGVTGYVSIRSAERRGGDTDGSWYTSPVDIEWYSYY
jgi:hypothetical protein